MLREDTPDLDTKETARVGWFFLVYPELLITLVVVILALIRLLYSADEPAHTRRRPAKLDLALNMMAQGQLYG